MSSARFRVNEELILSFIHLENSYSAPSRNLLRGDPSRTVHGEKDRFKQVVEQRRVALWYTTIGSGRDVNFR